MSQKHQAEEQEGEKPSEAKLNQNPGNIHKTPPQDAVSFDLSNISPIKVYDSDTSSEISENNIMTTAASDITYVFKITGNGHEKKVTLKKIEVKPNTMVKPLLKTEQTLELEDSEDDDDDDDDYDDDYDDDEHSHLEARPKNVGGSKHRKTRKKRKKKKKSRKKR